MAKKAKKTAKKPRRKAARATTKRSATPAKKKAGRKAAKKVVRKTTKKRTVRAVPVRAANRPSRTRSSDSRDKSSTTTTARRATKRSRNSGDFGIPAIEARDRACAGEDLMHRENEPRTARGNVVGNRESGVGAPDSGPGSSSGGDLDTDIIGVGTGSGLAQSGPEPLRDIGLAETDGSNDDFASGPPAKGENQGPGPDRVRGSTVMPTDDD